MARQHISFLSDEQKQVISLEARIQSGEITSENFSELSETEQTQVHKILFDMAAEKVNPNKGASALEFTLFAFMRVMTKKVQGMSLTEDEKQIDESLTRIMGLHQITNDAVSKSQWDLDYMRYAETKALEILSNRKEHLSRKQEVIGNL